MNKPLPDTASTEALEAWFANAGLTVEAVDRCPEPSCERCRRALDRAA